MSQQELEAAKKFFAADRFATEASGIEILEVDVANKYARCQMKIDSRHMNAAGRIMGGAIFTLADFTFAVASNCGLEKTVTVTSQITYLSSPKTDALISESVLIKDGKSMCTFQIHVRDSSGIEVALVTSSGMKLK